MTVFDSKARKVVDFFETAKADGLLEKMHPDMAALIAQFVKDYRASVEPAEALRDYYLKLAPIEAVFSRTRQLAKAAVAALECWSLCQGNAAAIQAETGAWVLGEDEADDLHRLEKFTAAFVKHFGAAALPAQLKGEEMKKQVAAHHKAHAEKPAMPPAQELSTRRAEKRDLGADCQTAFNAFHDFLDGYFGKHGDEAFAAKARYGYDRRAGTRKKEKPPEAGEKSDPAGKTEPGEKAEAHAKGKPGEKPQAATAG